MVTKVSGTLWVEMDNIEYGLEWKGSLYPGRPGKYSGPPESCYEDEPPEFEFTETKWHQEPHRPLTIHEEDDIFNRAFDQALEEASERYYDGDEGYDIEEDYA